MRQLAYIFALSSLLISSPTLAQSTNPATPAAGSAIVTTKTAIKVKPVASSTAVAATPTPAASSDVWVNGKVYHCPGSTFYGKTKKGSFMSEEAAKEAGARVAHGRPCQK